MENSKYTKKYSTLEEKITKQKKKEVHPKKLGSATPEIINQPVNWVIEIQKNINSMIISSNI